MEECEWCWGDKERQRQEGDNEGELGGFGVREEHDG